MSRVAAMRSVLRGAAVDTVEHDWFLVLAAVVALFFAWRFPGFWSLLAAVGIWFAFGGIYMSHCIQRLIHKYVDERIPDEH